MKKNVDYRKIDRDLELARLEMAARMSRVSFVQ